MVAYVLDCLLLVQSPAQEVDLEGGLMHQPLGQPVLAILVFLGYDLHQFFASPEPTIDEGGLDGEEMQPQPERHALIEV